MGVRITQLPEKTTALEGGDFFVVDDGTNAQKVDAENLYKDIIETYSGTELGGSEQDLKTAINALYSALSAATTPTTVTGTYATGFTNYSTGTVPTFVKYGRVVMVYGQAKPTASITGGPTNILMFPIPEGYRPAGRIAILQQASSARIWLLSLQNGNGYLSRGRSGSSWADFGTSEWLQFYACYICDPEA